MQHTQYRGRRGGALPPINARKRKRRTPLFSFFSSFFLKHRRNHGDNLPFDTTIRPVINAHFVTTGMFFLLCCESGHNPLHPAGFLSPPIVCRAVQNHINWEVERAWWFCGGGVPLTFPLPACGLGRLPVFPLAG